MKDLEEIRQRCVITDDGHWIWRGAVRPDGRPSISAPDIGRGCMRTQSGPRAVWQMSTGRAIPDGWRAFGICPHKRCCNPQCVRCGTEKEFGKWMTKLGRFATPQRAISNRASALRRTKLTDAQILEVTTSPETGAALAARFGVSAGLISRARRGQLLATRGANPFAGLLAANDAHGRKRA